MLQIQLVALALAATTLVASGCGGSSKSGSTQASASTASTTATTPATPTTTTTAATTTTSAATTTQIPSVTVKVASGTPLSRTQWLIKSNAICTHTNAELEALSVTKTSELPRILPQEAAYVRAEVARLAKLVPPAAVSSDWQQFLNTSLQWAEGSSKLAEQGSLGDYITRSPIATATIAIHDHALSIARRSGLKACSQP